MTANLHLVRESRDAINDLPIRVVLADDHRAVRRNLRLLLDSEDGIEVVEEAADLTAVEHHVNAHRPHVLTLDLHLPNGSALATIDRLRRESPETAIVVLTMEQSPAFAKRALARGVIGYVLKDQADQDLIPAVRAAAKGIGFISPQIAAGIRAMDSAEAADRLSDREMEVLRLTALGHTSPEIARLLHISQRTVDSHRAAVHRKLGLRTRAELVEYALHHHLLG